MMYRVIFTQRQEINICLIINGVERTNMTQRPAGVAVLAVLALVFGILLILGSVLTVAVSAFITES